MIDKSVLLFVPLILSSIISCDSVFSMSTLQAHEIAIMQFDSRPMENYWLASATWNDYYAKTHGHVFLYYNLNEDCRYDNVVLAQAWCKVKAMLQANQEYPEIKVFIYMDSDAVIAQDSKGTSLVTFLTLMQERLQWDPNERPMVFNQDGPCWWCNLIKKVGYQQCLNAGTVLWYRHPYSEEILVNWWHSSMDSYADNPLNRKFRNSWPWEQDRQMALYHKSPKHIQIASHPNATMLVTKRSSLETADWCLSHLPQSGCFIAHHCANPAQKQRMIAKYRVDSNENIGGTGVPFTIHTLTM